MKRPITEKALIARVNRALKDERERISVTRWDAAHLAELGRHSRVDTQHNMLIETHVDLVALARDLEVMGEHEELRDPAAEPEGASE
ncbi:MAG: hypothetical protein ABR558_06825 [Thioalkalivibrio sp.]